MRLMFGRKDGGPESLVWAYGLEIKSLFSVLVLRFENGSREAYHSHAFNAVSWLLSGTLDEFRYRGDLVWLTQFRPALKPIVTTRDNKHMVESLGRSWVLSFRGPWVDQWHEEVGGESLTLTHGRVRV